METEIKYLLINLEEIFKQSYIQKRKQFIFGRKMIYIPGEKKSGKELLAKYNIPEEFQKIIVKVNVPTDEAVEYTTGFPFNLTTNKIKKENTGKRISATNYNVQYNKQAISDKISFNVNLEFLSHDSVIAFLQRLKDSGYLEQYHNALAEFFDISLNHSFDSRSMPYTKRRMLSRSKFKKI